MLPLFSQMLTPGGGRPQITTWDPAHKGADLTLSNGNLTVTSYALADESVLATTSKASGKWACRYTISGTSVRPGFATTMPGGVLGETSQGVAYNPATGAVRVDAATLATLPTAGGGDVLDMVLDATNKLFWLRINGGDWNDDSSASPSTGALGIALTGLDAGPCYPASWLGSTVGQTVTAQFYGVAYPANVAAWDE